MSKECEIVLNSRDPFAGIGNVDHYCRVHNCGSFGITGRCLMYHIEELTERIEKLEKNDSR